MNGKYIGIGVVAFALGVLAGFFVTACQYTKLISWMNDGAIAAALSEPYVPLKLITNRLKVA